MHGSGVYPVCLLHVDSLTCTYVSLARTCILKPELTLHLGIFSCTLSMLSQDVSGKAMTFRDILCGIRY
jgi:hypothetical protein